MKKRRKEIKKRKGNLGKFERYKREMFILALLLVILLNAVIYNFDVEIIKFIEGLRTTTLDYFFLSIGFAGSAIIIFFFLTSLFLWEEHKRRWIIPLWFSGFFAFVLSYLIKVIVARPRPFEKGLISFLQVAFYLLKDNFNTWNFSFPSFHAALVFSALPVLNKEFKRFKYVWLVFACLVAFSRAYFGLHYLSDVLAGAVIGYLIGFIMVKIEEKYEVGLTLREKLRISK